jgi:hypothetical protein
MAETPANILVKVEWEERVPTVVVATVAEEFAEWLDNNGWVIAPKGNPEQPDERSYEEELSRDFAEEWAKAVPS